jgi:hypothetical protein
MPPDRRSLRFYFDESLLGVGKAVAIARRDTVHVGHPLVEAELPLGILDVEWIPTVAKHDLVVLLCDRRIRTKPAELLALREHRVRVFWVAGKKNLSVWATLVRLVHRWPEMERIVAARGPGPWFMAVNEGEIVEIPLPSGSRARPNQLRDRESGSRVNERHLRPPRSGTP